MEHSQLLPGDFKLRDEAWDFYIPSVSFILPKISAFQLKTQGKAHFHIFRSIVESELRKRGNSRSANLRNFRSYEKENANNRRSMFFLQAVDEMNEFELDENELVNPLHYREDANALNKPAIASNV